MCIRDSITEFAEKPKEPKSNLASMGIYVFSWQTLRKYLTEDEADPNSENDFGKNVIPAMLGNGEVMAAYRFSGYWKDVGTLESLWDANMDMLSPESVSYTHLLLAELLGPGEEDGAGGFDLVVVELAEVLHVDLHLGGVRHSDEAVELHVLGVNHGAVSYTHLDVYKRQPLHRP